MFYVNNKQVIGMFLNGNSYSYLSYGFGKIIPENRSAQFAYLNLAQRYLSQYRVEYGNIQSGYNNFPITRLDYPVNGVFHSPLTYYYGGNIVPTKNVPVYINNGYCALKNALVYNDININGNIVHFATNTDFRGHNVNIHPENSRSNSPYFNGTVMNNCSNCNITTRYIVPGFDHMNHCNFDIYLSSNANVEKSRFYSLLTNSYNCNYNLNALNSNLFIYRNGGNSRFFESLNNCNLNLLVSNTLSFNRLFGDNLSNCNIVFNNIIADLSTFTGWLGLHNCNISGNVSAAYNTQGFLARCNNLNVNLNCAGSVSIKPLSLCGNVNGNITLGKDTIIEHCNGIRLLNVNNGNLMFNNINHGNFKVYNTITRFRNVNNTNAWSKSMAYVSAIDNCHNLFLYGLNVVNDTVIENVYDSNLVFNTAPGGGFRTSRVNNCSIIGFPYSFTYTTNCRFDVGLGEAIARNSRYMTWANVWPHGFKVSSAYGYLAGLSSVNNFIALCYISSTDMVFGGSKTFVNNNNMLTDLDTYFNGTVTANLSNYASNIKLNVDCHNLNLGVFMAGPPHGLEYSSISADNIFCTTGKDYYVYMNYGTRIYCENFCNVPFSPVWRKFSDNYQPVMLINNYRHSNGQACNFKGGIYRIGRLIFQGGRPADMDLSNGACMFINNVVLNKVEVNNALLFIGDNVSIMQNPNVYNGGLVVNKANYSMGAIGKFVNRNNFTWNFTDSGPWGERSLLEFCTDV